MIEIEPVNLPRPSRPDGSKYDAIVKRCQAHPGQWFRMLGVKSTAGRGAQRRGKVMGVEIIVAIRDGSPYICHPRETPRVPEHLQARIDRQRP